MWNPKEMTQQMHSPDMFIYLPCSGCLSFTEARRLIGYSETCTRYLRNKTYVVSDRIIGVFYSTAIRLVTGLHKLREQGRCDKVYTMERNTVKSVKSATCHSWPKFHEKGKFLWYYTWSMGTTPYLGHLWLSWLLVTVSHVVATLSV
jgi:hypothetical protein